MFVFLLAHVDVVPCWMKQDLLPSQLPGLLFLGGGGEFLFNFSFCFRFKVCVISNLNKEASQAPRCRPILHVLGPRLGPLAVPFERNLHARQLQR